MIIFSPPLIYQYLRFFQSGKDLSVKQFISHLAVKGFNITIYSGTAEFDK